MITGKRCIPISIFDDPPNGSDKLFADIFSKKRSVPLVDFTLKVELYDVEGKKVYEDILKPHTRNEDFESKITYDLYFVDIETSFQVHVTDKYEVKVYNGAENTYKKVLALHPDTKRYKLSLNVYMRNYDMTKDHLYVHIVDSNELVEDMKKDGITDSESASKLLDILKDLFGKK